MSAPPMPTEPAHPLHSATLPPLRLPKFPTTSPPERSPRVEPAAASGPSPTQAVPFPAIGTIAGGHKAAIGALRGLGYPASTAMPAAATPRRLAGLGTMTVAADPGTMSEPSEESSGEEFTRKRTQVKPIGLGLPPAATEYRGWLNDAVTACTGASNRPTRRASRYMKTCEKSEDGTSLLAVPRTW